MADSVDFGKVLGLNEERHVAKNAKGDLIAGNTQQSLDLLLRNAKGDEKLVGIPVGADVVDFFSDGAPKDLETLVLQTATE